MLINDKWGSRPLFYIIKNQQLISSENMDDLLDQLPDPTLNPQAIARFLIEDFSHPTETLFNEIKKAPQSELKDIDLTFHSMTKEELCLEWSTQLKKNLLHILQKHKKCGIFLSGGLDSSGLVALSADIIRSHKLDCEIELYHIRTNNSESDDRGFVQKISSEFNLRLYIETITPDLLTQEFFRWKKTKSSIPFFPTLQMFSPLLKKAAENGCQTILFGYGVDEQWTLSPPSLWLHLKHQLKKGIPKQIKWMWSGSAKRDLDLRIDSANSLFSNLFQKQLYLRNYFSGNNSYNLACHISLAAPYNLQVHFPYLSCELLDLSITTPAKLFFQLQDKYLLRRTLKGLLTDDIRLAPKFQDYSQLAYKTALQIQKQYPEYLNKPYQVRFDDDSFFEACFIQKISQMYKGIKNEKFSLT